MFRELIMKTFNWLRQIDNFKTNQYKSKSQSWISVITYFLNECYQFILVDKRNSDKRTSLSRARTWKKVKNPITTTLTWLKCMTFPLPFVVLCSQLFLYFVSNYCNYCCTPSSCFLTFLCYLWPLSAKCHVFIWDLISPVL